MSVSQSFDRPSIWVIKFLGSFENLYDYLSICICLPVYTTDPNLLYFLGQPKVFECSAEGGRPAGTFNWRIGDSNDPKGTLALTNPNPPKVLPAENGYVSEV
jgi:hypothetical protein